MLRRNYSAGRGNTRGVKKTEDRKREREEERVKLQIK